MKCGHCQRGIQGNAVVDGALILHSSCVEPYRRHLRGLDHECPKCRTTGKMDDPSGRKHHEEVSLPYGATPKCAYNGCMGCHYCRNMVESVEVPDRVACDLCEGVGWLTSPAVPVMKAVDWKRS